MAGSAQWMSSTTTTTGRSAASAEKKVRHAACISSRTRFGSSSASGVSGSSRPVVKAMAAVARSGSGAAVRSVIPTERILSSATAGVSVSETSAMLSRISDKGQYVMPSPYGRHRPRTTNGARSCEAAHR